MLRPGIAIDRPCCAWRPNADPVDGESVSGAIDELGTRASIQCGAGEPYPHQTAALQTASNIPTIGVTPTRHGRVGPARRLCLAIERLPVRAAYWLNGEPENICRKNGWEVQTDHRLVWVDIELTVDAK